MNFRITILITMLLLLATACSGENAPSATATMPAAQPITQSTNQPTSQPTDTPTSQPTNEPTAQPTIQPTSQPTNVPPTETAVSPLQQTVTQIITLLNSNAREGYPLAETFFHGVYGARVWQTEGQFIPGEVATNYAGDTYSIRTLALSADLNAPLPDTVSYETAVSLNPTDAPVSQIVYSSGWGVDQPGEALLYFTEENGQPRWLGAILSFNGFSALPQYETASPSAEVVQFLATDEARQATLTELAERFDAPFYTLSLNPSGTVALYASQEHEFGAYEFEVIDMATGETAVFQTENGLGIAAHNAVWRDEQTVFVGYRDGMEDEGPVWGHLALLDTRTGKLTKIEPDRLLGQQPSVTPDGTAVYTTGNQIMIWQNSEGSTLGDALATGALPYPGLSAPALSAAKTHLIAISCGTVSAESRKKCSYRLFDIATGSSQPVATFDPPPMGGSPSAAQWNNAGTWAVISPWANFAEQRGLTLVNTAGETIFLGVDTYNGRFATDNLLIFDAYINDEQQQHSFDLTARTRTRLLKNTASPFDGLIFNELTDFSQRSIVQNGEPQRLTQYETAQLLPTLGYEYAVVNDAVFVAHGGNLLRLTLAGQKRIELERQVENVYGVVGESVMISSLPSDAEVNQSLGQLTAVSPTSFEMTVISGERGATFPIVAPDGSQIIFWENDAAYAYLADGSVEKRPYSFFRSGAISPDGQSVVLLRSGVVNIYSLVTNELLFTDSVRNSPGDGYFFPTWNPNSHQVAYFAYLPEQEPPVATRLASLDGTVQQFDLLFEVAFSPDGTQLAAYQNDGSNPQLVLIDLVTGEKTAASFVGYPLGWVEEQ